MVALAQSTYDLASTFTLQLLLHILLFGRLGLSHLVICEVMKVVTRWIAVNPPTLLPALNFNVTFSEMVVVALSGPAGLPFSTPNFAHFALSATA
jgi:hypothetical protein